MLLSLLKESELEDADGQTEHADQEREGKNHQPERPVPQLTL
jgi:hypothetical protein